MIGTWTLEGDTLYLDKGTAGETAISYDAETQTLGQNGFVFTQKKVKNFKPGKTAKANAEDFTGKWTTTKVEPAAAALPLNLANFNMNVVIDGTHVVLTETDAKVIREGEAIFADNTLQLIVPAADKSGKESVYTIAMMKNGMIRITTDSAKYYLEKTEPEA